MSDEPMTMVTYKRVDGRDWFGEYTFLTDRDQVDDAMDDVEELVEEVTADHWVLVRTETLRYGILNRSCAECDDDVELTEPTMADVFCDACDVARGRNVSR